MFVVATANDISALPPELIRKGRLTIFFVDLPGAVRAQIFKIHSARRSVTLEDTHLNELAAASEGFSGAEIEQAVVAAVYTAHASEVAMNATHIAQEIKATHPLCVVMEEQISALREWARERTVPAD